MTALTLEDAAKDALAMLLCAYRGDHLGYDTIANLYQSTEERGMLVCALVAHAVGIARGAAQFSGVPVERWLTSVALGLQERAS